MKNSEGVLFTKAVTKVVNDTTRNTDINPILYYLFLFLISLKRYVTFVAIWFIKPTFYRFLPSLSI